MALLSVDLEIRLVGADGNICIVLVEGEGGDWADMELVHVGRHCGAERGQTGRGDSRLAATRTGDWR